MPRCVWSQRCGLWAAAPRQHVPRGFLVTCWGDRWGAVPVGHGSETRWEATTRGPQARGVNLTCDPPGSRDTEKRFWNWHLCLWGQRRTSENRSDGGTEFVFAGNCLWERDRDQGREDKMGRRGRPMQAQASILRKGTLGIACWEPCCYDKLWLRRATERAFLDAEM